MYLTLSDVRCFNKRMTNNSNDQYVLELSDRAVSCDISSNAALQQQRHEEEEIYFSGSSIKDLPPVREARRTNILTEDFAKAMIPKDPENLYGSDIDTMLRRIGPRMNKLSTGHQIDFILVYKTEKVREISQPKYCVNITFYKAYHLIFLILKLPDWTNGTC